MKTLLTNCVIIDCVQPEPIENTSVLIENGIIKSIQKERENIPDAKIVDLKGAYLLPGLWDCHCHPGGMTPDTDKYASFETDPERTLRALRNTQSVLHTGVTSIRAVGEASFIDVALREAYSNKTPTGLWREAYTSISLHGPRMFVAGPGLRITGGHGANRRIRRVELSHGSVEVDGADEVRKATRYNLKMGVDWIKLAITGGIAGIREGMKESQMTFDEIKSACDAAHNKGIKVCAHLGSSEAVKLAISAGLDCVEHGYNLDQEAVDLMAEKDIFWIPTLSVTQDEAYMRRYCWPEHSIKRALEGAEAHVAGFKMALDAGVKIASGADLNPMRETSVVEIEWLARSGMTNWQALLAATRNSAELCGVDNELGTIEEGKKADLIVLKANPLEDISNLHKLMLVFKEGAIVVRARAINA